jgi:hypothetical protein
MSAQPKLRCTLEDVIKLTSCSCELSLKEIYRDVKFGAGKNK